MLSGAQVKWPHLRAQKPDNELRFFRYRKKQKRIKNSKIIFFLEKIFMENFFGEKRVEFWVQGAEFFSKTTSLLL